MKLISTTIALAFALIIAVVACTSTHTEPATATRLTGNITQPLPTMTAAASDIGARFVRDVSGIADRDAMSGIVCLAPLDERPEYMATAVKESGGVAFQKGLVVRQQTANPGYAALVRAPNGLTGYVCIDDLQPTGNAPPIDSP